jgi:hypothetical protein
MLSAFWCWNADIVTSWLGQVSSLLVHFPSQGAALAAGYKAPGAANRPAAVLQCNQQTGLLFALAATAALAVVYCASQTMQLEQMWE